MDQHTQEWWDARLGKVTASRIGDLMARTQKGWGAPRKHYLAEKVAERVTGKPRDRRKVASLDQRLEMEPDARAAYEFYRDVEVVQVGFIEHPRIPMAGASPDGRVLPKGGLEIKCLDEEQHLDLLLAQAIDSDYIYQMQFNIACTEADWWDFASFNPNMPEQGKLFVQRIERDDIMIAKIETAVIEFLAEVDQKVRQVEAVMSGSTPLALALEGSLQSLQVN